jgi:hypothetical protein
MAIATNKKCTLEGFPNNERKFIIRKGLYLEKIERIE